MKKSYSLSIMSRMPMFQDDGAMLDRFNTEYDEASKVYKRNEYDLPATTENVAAAKDFVVLNKITPEQFLAIVSIRESKNPKESRKRACSYATTLLQKAAQKQ